jgi:CheY-like chemotaxis protein
MTILRRVLVVEDDTATRELLIHFFQYHQVEVVAVSSGEDALDCPRTFVPTMIMVDLALPKMDGWTLLKRVKENPAWAPIPVVAMTLFHTERMSQQALDAGFKAYLAKPLNVITLIDVRQNLLVEKTG